MEIIKRLDTADNLELLSVHSQVTDFPEHYHETFCISLIRNGTEVIKSGESKIFTTTGNISISNPYEIHANPILDREINVGFDTIYVSQPLVDWLLNTKGISFENVQTSSNHQITLFNTLKFCIQNRLNTKIEVVLIEFLQALDLKRSYTELDKFNHSSQFIDVLGFIETNYHQKISLEKLAKIAYMDKYNFAKQFRKAVGLSPINYVLMKRIFYAKSLISQACVLTELAHELGFTDQSHFNKTFKQFVGISPSVFQSNL